MAAALIFTYGTLKQGFPNHGLLQDMISTGDASFVSACNTTLRFPLVCGPYRVPFLLNLPSRGHRVSGELYAVSPEAVARMDDLEGTGKGHYERLPIEIESAAAGTLAAGTLAAEAYYAHRSYAEALWRRSGEEVYNCYTEKVARGYVRRKDRPQHLTFLGQIGQFVASDSGSGRPEAVLC